MEFAFETHVDVGAPLSIGETGHGLRRIVPILGGTFEGPRVRGIVLPGSDWQVQRPDGVLEIKATYALQTDDGALITIVNEGLRHAPAEVMDRLNRGEPVDPAEVYFRTVPRFETASPAHAWLTRSILVGYGERRPEQVIIRFWAML